MKVENIQYADKYNYLTDAFRKAYKWLKETNLESLEVGKYPIAEGIFALVQAYKTIEPSQAKFENHDKYFDIQYVVKGKEKFGVCKTKDLVLYSKDEENDLNFYEEPLLSGEILLEEGDFVIVAPEDAHKPRLIAGEVADVKKIVIKVKLELGINKKA